MIDLAGFESAGISFVTSLQVLWAQHIAVSHLTCKKGHLQSAMVIVLGKYGLFKSKGQIGVKVFKDGRCTIVVLKSIYLKSQATL